MRAEDVEDAHDDEQQGLEHLKHYRLVQFHWGLFCCIVRYFQQ